MRINKIPVTININPTRRIFPENNTSIKSLKKIPIIAAGKSDTKIANENLRSALSPLKILRKMDLISF